MGRFIKEGPKGIEISTPVGRLSWTFIFSEDPRQKPNDQNKYKTTIMLPKNEKALDSLGLNPKQVAKVLADVNEFVEEFKAHCESIAKPRFGAKWQKTRWCPMLDGDDLTDTWEGNANFWIIRTKSKFKPTVIDKNRETIDTDANPEGLYSGCWARIKLSTYCYDVDGNKGVAAGLGFFIQKQANDDEFGTATSTEEAFDDDVEDLDIADSDFDSDDLDDDDELT